jgi:uracil-DNA glycosylase family 4
MPSCIKADNRVRRTLVAPDGVGGDDEIVTCRWWLDRELEVLRPSFVVALGATAAFALMGRSVVLARERGRLLHRWDGRAGLATIHRSAILRLREESERHEAFRGFANDLRERCAWSRPSVPH